MQHALLDILTGEYKNPEFNSIKTHLSRLLNSRQGSLAHMPNYGLPDVKEIYQGLPYSVDKLIMAVKKTIETYEPRLQNVRIKPKIQHDGDCILRLKIFANINSGEQMQFDANFTSAGSAKIAE